ncbi:tetratricopeptide repeat protein [Streptomyces sp. HUAS MG91]|uniref:Tetratricopeptide repeat protein n=1 Tax=Streptomyces tabacisoli TaxID=3156398 RepID=A0AAU8IYL9_9ACTN
MSGAHGVTPENEPPENETTEISPTENEPTENDAGASPTLWSVDIPRQLPRAATHFTDRVAEMTLLDEAASGADGLVVVSGQAGVGKSALAVQWARQAADRFPDGQLYTDLRGYHSLPAQRPEEALNSFLLAFNAPMENLRGHLDAMASRFRTVLHGRRVLMVIDNVRSAEQVIPLLPGSPGCCVVVTSRSDLSSLAATHGAERVPLPPLPGDDAVRLFSLVSRQGRTQQMARLAEQCGRLPLALRIVAERSQTAADITDLIRTLEDPAQRMDVFVSDDEEMGVPMALSWSYAGLSGDKARAFRLLALHAGPDFSHASAAALLNVPLEPAQRLLRSLKSDNLLEEMSDRRYRFHDLVRDYARARVLAEESEAERAAAVRRELEYYLRCCDAVDRLLAPQRQHVPVDENSFSLPLPDLPHPAAALAWCDAEVVSIAAAVDQARRGGMHDLAWKIPISLIYYFVVRHHHTYRHDLSVVALRAARLCLDTWAEIWANICLGGATGEVGRHAEAAEYFSAALDLSRRTGDRKWEDIAHNNLAWTLRLAGRYEEAYVQQKQALERHVSGQNLRSQAVSLNELATLSLILDQPERALEHLLAALPRAVEADDALQRAAILHQLGTTTLRLGDREAAVEWWGQAVSLRREVDDRPGLADSLVELGLLRVERDLDMAREALTEALKVMESLRHPRTEEIRSMLETLSS